MLHVTGLKKKKSGLKTLYVLRDNNGEIFEIPEDTLGYFIKCGLLRGTNLRLDDEGNVFDFLSTKRASLDDIARAEVMFTKLSERIMNLIKVATETCVDFIDDATSITFGRYLTVKLIL